MKMVRFAGKEIFEQLWRDLRQATKVGKDAFCSFLHVGWPCISHRVRVNAGSKSASAGSLDKFDREARTDAIARLHLHGRASKYDN